MAFCRSPQCRNLCEVAGKSPGRRKEFDDYINDRLPADWDKHLKALEEKAISEQTKVAPRKASQLCLEQIMPYVPQIVGGSADLSASNLTFVDGMKTVTADDYNGNNIIMYGIRERHGRNYERPGIAWRCHSLWRHSLSFLIICVRRCVKAPLMGIRAIYVPNPMILSVSAKMGRPSARGTPGVLSRNAEYLYFPPFATW